MKAAGGRFAFAVAALALVIALAVGLAGANAGSGGGLAVGQHGRVRQAAASSPAARPSGLPGQRRSAFSLRPPTGPGNLAPGSDPSALPGDVLIADENNNRLLLVDPYGRVRWQFPASGTLPGGGIFGPPDDAFVSPNGRDIVATQEENDTVSVVSIADSRVVASYGHPGTPGSAPDYFSHPDDAMVLPGGDLLLADIINCRILLLAPGPWQVVRQFGSAGSCYHDPPATFGSPNGVFPLTDGHYLVTEINGDWVDEMDLQGHVYWSAHPPGVAYPSDACEFAPGEYITTDYSTPGQVVIFAGTGRLLWRFRPTGANALNHPSLALPLPGGDVLVNDDYNDRVIAIDPVTNQIVWQYGHTGVPGSAPGYLSKPDGVDMAPPYSLLVTHAPTMGHP
jgi:outer membrane protein assembly factor BamB